MERNTKTRIVEAALELFAQRGFRGTTIDAIAEAAGLTPRSGALYRHFPSKRAILEAGLERAVSSVEAVQPIIDLMPLGDIRAELTLLVRWALQEIASESHLARVMANEGGDFPELLGRYRDNVVQRGYEAGAELFRRHIHATGGPDLDPAALAAIGLGAIASYRQVEDTFGQPPGGVDQETFIATWVELWHRVANEHTPERPPS